MPRPPTLWSRRKKSSSFAFDHLRDGVLHPARGLGIGEVDEPAQAPLPVVGRGEPLRVLPWRLGSPRRGAPRPSRAPTACRARAPVAEGAQPVRETLRGPTCQSPTVLHQFPPRRGVPARVDEEDLRADLGGAVDRRGPRAPAVISTSGPMPDSTHPPRPRGCGRKTLRRRCSCIA